MNLIIFWIVLIGFEMSRFIVTPFQFLFSKSFRQSRNLVRIQQAARARQVFLRRKFLNLWEDWEELWQRAQPSRTLLRALLSSCQTKFLMCWNVTRVLLKYNDFHKYPIPSLNHSNTTTYIHRLYPFWL